MPQMGILGLVAGSIVVAITAVAIAVFFKSRQKANRRELSIAEGRRLFHRRRECLEALFFKLASTSGRPRGLAWVECEFSNDVSFARERASGHLRALVGVTIRFEAVEGGGMEDVPAVNDLRAATAVFSFDGNRWETDGRVIYNLNPDEAIRHFRHELEAVVD